LTEQVFAMDSSAQPFENNSSLCLSLIRGFELRSGESVVQVAPSAQRLVAFVALQDRAVRRLHASGVLWTDAPEQRANSSLRSALWRTPSPDGRPLIQASSTHLWLNPAVTVDFRETVSRALSVLDREDGLQSADHLRGQLCQFGDDLLPDWYDDWLLGQQERFRQLRLHALEAICGHLTDLGRYALALEAGLAAVACEPLRESAQRQVIRVHLKEGNAAEALRQYRSYARLLAAELGARPSRSMDRLLEGVTGNLAAVRHKSSGFDMVHTDHPAVTHRGRRPPVHSTGPRLTG